MSKLKTHARLSLLITGVGLALMVMMIFVEDEPGGISVLFVVVGMGGYMITRWRMRLHDR